jgi:hypothetical protein
LVSTRLRTGAGGRGALSGRASGHGRPFEESVVDKPVQDPLVPAAGGGAACEAAKASLAVLGKARIAISGEVEKDQALADPAVTDLSTQLERARTHGKDPWQG